jgi:serine/threonine protein kinase
MDSVPPVPSSEGPAVLADRYELGPLLGRGGMGEVRAGWDRRLTRRVAVKVLRPDMAVQPEVRRRFEHEARMAAQLVHPSVVAVFDTGEDGEVAFLVMEQLSGRTLSERMAAGRLDAEEARVLGIQVLDALEAAHRIGLVHRDIKPGNILEAGPGGWKVGDFGIAKSLEATDPALTATGLVIGTPAYLAPERLAGGPATPASDLYAAGAVLYEAVAGRRVLPAGAPLAAWSARPAPLEEVRPDLPPALVGLVTRAMDPDPARRFSSAGEMAEAYGSAGCPEPPRTRPPPCSSRPRRPSWAPWRRPPVLPPLPQAPSGWVPPSRVGLPPTS